MPSLKLLDIADISTWTLDCVDFIDEVCEQLDSHSPSWNSTSYNDLGYELGNIEDQFRIESELRTTVLAGAGVLLNHFSRLLPQQAEEIRASGLSPLSSAAHNDRQRRAAQVLGLNAEGVVTRLSRSPKWIANREGQLWGVAPLRPAASEAGDGLTCFLESYGGEVTYFDGGESGDLQEVLRAASEPSIVQFLAPPTDLNSYTHLWKVMAAQRRGNHDAWQEWHTEAAVPPDRVIRILSEDSEIWPY